MKLSKRTSQKLARLRKQIERLPVAERQLWRARVSKRLKQPPALIVGELVYTESGERVDSTARPQSQSELDLELANWLDRVYGVVSDRVAVVAQKGASAVREAGFSLWPIAVVAIALAWSYSQGRRYG